MLMGQFWGREGEKLVVYFLFCFFLHMHLEKYRSLRVRLRVWDWIDGVFGPCHVFYLGRFQWKPAGAWAGPQLRASAGVDK